MTIEMSKYAMEDYQIRNALQRMEIIDYIVCAMRSVGEFSRIRLDKLVKDRFGALAPSIVTFESFFETKGWIRTENRKEEEITITVKDYVYYDKHGEVVPEKVKAVILPEGKICEVDNPDFSKLYSFFKKEEVEKNIQVTRKYWVWVG